jgi:hypothetical protein
VRLSACMRKSVCFCVCACARAGENVNELGKLCENEHAKCANV